MAGVAPRTLQVLGGWKTLAMVERYRVQPPKSRPPPRRRGEAHGAANQVGEPVERRTVRMTELTAKLRGKLPLEARKYHEV